ncbi:T-complex protein 1 subunit beta [Operophtera brumata]|uniref:T-complex protein 1 subunit beta n=1 Tax=Operophtera brumata TaxID=104452 RepID=A0A0L7L465_OPEBR|nr:T-complex protein 1 subunit beta [Operophtera brumata]
MANELVGERMAVASDNLFVSLNPIRILSNEAEEEKAEVARMSSFIGAIAIGDLVKSTLGPKGMDKMLVSCGRNAGQVEVTNDGATILKSIGVDNPAAKILVDMAKVQDEEVGDGTTSVTVLAAELLREAEKLVEQKLHPQTIISGWRIAAEAARTALAEAGFDHEKNFNEAALRISGGLLEESFLDEGFLLNKKVGVHQPKRIENASILVANTPMDTDKIKVFGSTIKVDSMAKIAELEVAEKEKMKDKVNKILAHKCNHADFDGIERLALVTGAEIASTFDSPDRLKLGHCKVIEQVLIGDECLIRFSGVELGAACSVVIRGATQQVIDEAERSLHDALCVLAATVKEPKVVYGGGASEMLMAEAVSRAAARTAGKEAAAVEAFAIALRRLPSANGSVGDMKTLGITESYVVKRQVLLSAAEAAEMILRVDNILKSAPRRRGPDRRPC